MMTIGVAWLLALAAYDDIRTREIRIIYILIFAIAGIVLNILTPPESISSILCGVLTGVVVLIFSILSNEKIGKGDALLLMVIGLYLGFYMTIALLWLASIMAAIFGIAIIGIKKEKLRYEIPFVPFLLVAYIFITTLKWVGGYLA